MSITHRGLLKYALQLRDYTLKTTCLLKG